MVKVGVKVGVCKSYVSAGLVTFCVELFEEMYIPRRALIHYKVPCNVDV